ncbi:TadE/TadG family type IV pilus assembly protein [Serinicoccus sediminis]|uniref:TadE/TadG family type IV pilus assembly protein n=1 Tax=Serinicoccus sediminis TaxID=2306021 RepID=UPI00101FB2B5|nr:TadE family protein [Serinicoccus sediminis]
MPRPRRPRTRREAGRPAERGTSALELAIVAPVLLSLIFFSLQAAFFFYGRAAATHAAREGVSMLRLAEDRSDYAALQPDALARTERFASGVGGPGLTAPEVGSTYVEEGDGTARVTVTVSGRVITLVPGLRLTASADASGTVERFLEPGQAP